MRNIRNATTRRTPTPLAISVLLALAAILSLMGAVPAQTSVDYDADDDGLIEVANLARLNAIRYDMDANGIATNAAYATAFPNAATGMGCPGACIGYELTADLDFDTNGDGSVSTTGDTYWNGGAGWSPLGSFSDRFGGVFKGNRHTIDNLFINITASQDPTGLFASIGADGRVESLGVINASVTTTSAWNGILSGYNLGEIVACHTTGSVSGSSYVGGLTGNQTHTGTTHSSYSTATATGTGNTGGLIGYSSAHAAGENSITNSYSTGTVTRSSGTLTTIGGLVGGVASGISVAASYYDSTSSGCVSAGTAGCTTSAAGTAQTTSALQTPTGYTGIYANWNADVDGSLGNDSPWTFGTNMQYPMLAYGDPGDYDTDNDNYIDIRSHAQFNAIRYDLDGNGTQDTGVSASDWAKYTTVFPSPNTGMGCAATCVGYELAAHIDLDTNLSGAADSADLYWNGGDGWLPIGASSNRYAANFKGNGFTVDNLYISRASTSYIGLFGDVASGARIETIGVTNANVTGRQYTAVLAGTNRGAIVASFTTGSVTATGNAAGGLVGYLQGTITTSYSTASVSGSSQFGGLVGYLYSGSITNSYAAGAVSGSGGGLLGALGGGAVTASYWDATTSGRTASAGGSGVQSKTTAELQTPTDYGAAAGDLYYGWNIDIDGTTGNDDPWDFGLSTEYPALKYGGHSVFVQGHGDYDKDDDGYIDVANLAQLNVIRYDLDGDAFRGSTSSTNWTTYLAAFPGADTRISSRMGCPSGDCTGYELTANLDFDTNNDGSVTTIGDTYWNGGAGWDPIGDLPDAVDDSTRYQANFKGNGYTINNLYINRSGTAGRHSGLFGATHDNTRIESLGITNANVTGHDYTGILVGESRSAVMACYTTGKVEGRYRAGGLIGLQAGSLNIHSTYSTADVRAARSGGGLVGAYTSTGTISNSYSTGTVTRVSGSNTDFGGLLGSKGFGSGSAAASYWDTVSSGRSTSPGGGGVVGKTPRELQTVAGYTGIYANWNADLDGDGSPDDPWDFGNGMQYPMLKYGGLSADPQGGQAMGIADNWNAPVAGERVGVCLVDGPSMRGIVPGTQYRKPWAWERSTNGADWTAISGTGDGSSLPTYEYSPTATDVGNYLRAKVELADGSFAYTRALGGRVVAATTASAGPAISFIRGHASPRVGVEILTFDPLPSGAVEGRIGWQRCPNNTAPHSDCEAIIDVPGVYWISYAPTADDVGNYLRMYAYYQSADGTWTRRITPFTTAVVAAQ